MRRADFNSDAEYYRAHRAAFTLALELGCTPKSAEVLIRARETRECAARLRAKMDAPLQPGLIDLRAAHDSEERPLEWWKRD